MEQDRRRNPRYPFVGSIEMREGTSVTETEFFEAQASVIYSQADQGMGLMFRETKPYYLMVLRKWLLAAMMGKKGPRS